MRGGARGSGIGAVLGVTYILMGAIYFVPAYYLRNYGRRIGQFLRNGSMMLAEAALEAQKSFWKFVGILTLVVMGLYVAGIVLVMVGGMLAALARR